MNCASNLVCKIFWCNSIIKLVYLFFDLTYYISNNTMVEIENSRGIITTNLEDNKIKIKEIDKYGNLYKNSEIYLDEIQLLAVKNYKIMEGNHEEKF